MMQTSKECAVLKVQIDKGIGPLFERQVDPDPDGVAVLARDLDAFVCGLHQAGSAAGDNVTVHLRQCLGNSLRLFVGNSPRFCSRRPEDGHSISFALRWSYSS
jgi:hypothetical protein